MTETPSAFVVFKEQAELGDAEAQYHLGVMYETGWSVSVDPKKAVRWFLAAAKQGHAKAQFRLGVMNYLGVGLAQSSMQGERWIRQAAKQGHSLAEKLHQGLFVGELPDALKPAEVIAQVRKAYLQDERSALPVLEDLLRRARLQAQRVEKAKAQTTMGERRAQRNAQVSTKPGFATETDVDRVTSEVPAFFGDATVEEMRTLTRGSIATIRVQAESGLASAQHNLGRMYELGIKLPLDKQRALEWYEKSAQQGYAAAEYRLGIAYFYGVGAKRNEVLGKKWLTLAAQHDHPVAKNMVAELEHSSSATQQGVSLAVRWYLEQAIAGDALAALHLGKIYEHGWGVRANLHESLKWYQHANREGIEHADVFIEALQIKIKKKAAGKEPGRLGQWLDENGLPMWLSNPVVLGSFLLVLCSPLLLRRWRRRGTRPVLIEDKRSGVREV